MNNNQCKKSKLAKEVTFTYNPLSLETKSDGPLGTCTAGVTANVAVARSEVSTVVLPMLARACFLKKFPFTQPLLLML